jgi:hypothetical protein
VWNVGWPLSLAIYDERSGIHVGPFGHLVLAAIGVSFAVAPAICLYFTVMRRRQSQCCHCGYDLRATPERCPECGTAAATRPAAWSTPPGR